MNKMSLVTSGIDFGHETVVCFINLASESMCDKALYLHALHNLIFKAVYNSR